MKKTKKPERLGHRPGVEVIRNALEDADSLAEIVARECPPGRTAGAGCYTLECKACWKEWLEGRERRTEE